MKALEKWHANFSTQNVDKSGGNGFLPPKLPVLPWYNYWISKGKAPRSPWGWQSRGGPCVLKSDSFIKMLLRVLAVENHFPSTPRVFSTFRVEIFAYHFSSPVIFPPKRLRYIILRSPSVVSTANFFIPGSQIKWDYGKRCKPFRVSHCLPGILESWVECQISVVDSETSLFSSPLEICPLPNLLFRFKFSTRLIWNAESITLHHTDKQS